MSKLNQFLSKIFGGLRKFIEARPVKVEAIAVTFSNSRQIEAPEGMQSVTFTNTGNVPVKVNNWLLNSGGQLVMAADVGETNVTKFECTFYPTSTPPFIVIQRPELTASYCIKSQQVKDL